jgi:hypothetical protein
VYHRRISRDRTTIGAVGSKRAGPVAWQTQSVARQRSGEAVGVDDRLDVTVHDNEVLVEIDMMTNLIIATSESEEPLTEQRIDEILGVAPTIPRARQHPSS